MKKALAFLLCFLFIFAFAACGEEKSPTNRQDTSAASGDAQLSGNETGDDSPSEREATSVESGSAAGQESAAASKETEKSGQGADKAAASEKTEKSAASAASKETVTYPYTDKDGTKHYLLNINGKNVAAEHLPYKLSSEKGAMFPLETVLNYFGIEYATNEAHSAVVTYINGQLLRVYAGRGKMVFGNTTVSATNPNIAPTVVEGELYVPGFLLMSLKEKESVVDFSKDGKSCTLVTDFKPDAATSGSAKIDKTWLTDAQDLGHDEIAGVSGSPISGKHLVLCNVCIGQGRTSFWDLKRDPVTGNYTPVQVYRTCGNCGGIGHYYEST